VSTDTVAPAQTRRDTRVWEPIKPYGTRLRRQAGTDIYKSTIQVTPGCESAKSFRARNVTEAKAIHEKRRVDANAGIEIAAKKTKLDEVAEDFLSVFEGLVHSGERAPTTLERYELQYTKHLKPRFGHVKVQAIRAEHISRWLVDLRRSGLTDVASLYRLLSVLMNHAVTRGILVETPCKRLSKTERPRQRSSNPARRLSDEECSKLIVRALPGTRDLIAFYAYTGVRQAEGLGLIWDDLDLEDGTVVVRAQLARKKRDEPARRVALKTARRRKGCREREIELLPDLVALLKCRKADAFANGHARPEDFVFTTAEGRPLYYRNVARDLGKAADRAGLNRDGIPELTCHDLRHTAVSRWIASGIDPVTVARWAGDDLQTILDIYAGDFEKAKRRDANRELLAGGTSIRLVESRQ
jgi:integrase